LKLLAKELEVPIVAVSQLNRAAELRADKQPHMSDLRESGSLEQDADIVILLHRPGSAPRAGAGNAASREYANLIVAKHRNGPTATIDMLFLGHLAKFTSPSQQH
jgi:replicative DNA helicase